MKIAIVGATGLVGTVMLKVLQERNFPVTELLPVASEKSIGKTLIFKGEELKVIGMKEAIRQKPQVAIFSAGGSTSLEWAPKFAEAGITVIDNSSAWRMDSSKKLIVPEINADILTKEDKIIANPNCSTIQMVAALAPLHRQYGIKRLIISTYQSITGTGAKAVKQYEAEKMGQPLSPSEMAYPHTIFANCLPHCDVFMDNGYTKEEMKLVNETQKILEDPKIRISATAVRVPVLGGHSEAVNVEFENTFDIKDVHDLLEKTPGVTVTDNPQNNEYPMPLTAHGKNDIFVGRIRRDISSDKALNMWIVSDNLRKGAATNAIQIAEYLNTKGIIGK
ncbi:MAG TPA: aspartate-semialdehyde dehydrogenase [Saprospiraceae bacterium]|nr:aspartate-semialdehyde dehydrogenase [Saprospiraceae bacterium]